MDRENIQRIADQFIRKIIAEMVNMREGMIESVEGAVEEVEALGLSQNEASFLIWQVADVESMMHDTKRRFEQQTNRMVEALSTLEPDEEQEARRIIREQLVKIYTDLTSESGDVM